MLEAAEKVFGDEGTDASTEVIARRAGVGAGTVFRHFPTKEKLLEAVLERMALRLDAAARRCLDTKDPGGALFSALHHLVESTAAKKAVIDALSGAGVDVRAYPSLSRLWETVASCCRERRLWVPRAETWGSESWSPSSSAPRAPRSLPARTERYAIVSSGWCSTASVAAQLSRRRRVAVLAPERGDAAYR